MKKLLFLFFFLISFIFVNTENYFKNGSYLKIKCEKDSIFVIKNFDFSSKVSLKPSKNKEFLVKTEKNDSVIIFEDDSKNLLNFYFSKNLDKEGLLEYKIGIFQNYDMDDSLLVYLEKNYRLKKDYDSYSKLVDFLYEKKYQNLDSLLDFYYLNDSTNLNVIYKNSLVFKDLNENEKAFNILKKAIGILDSSYISFNIAVELVFDYEKIDLPSLKKLIDFTFENFYKNEDFIYILYQCIDFYEKGILKDEILSKMEKLLDQQISDDLRFSVSAFFIEKRYSVEKSVNNLLNLSESEIYYDYGDWLNFYLAKGYLILKDYEQSAKYLEIVEKEYNLEDMDVFKTGFDLAVETNDKKKIESYGIKLLSENLYDEKVLKLVEKNLGIKKKDIEKKVYTYLKSKMDTLKLPEFEIESMDGQKIKLSKIVNGKITILNFFSSTCPYCKKEINFLNEIRETYKKNKNFEFLAIASDNKTESLNKFINETKFSYTVFPNGSLLMDSLKIEGVPTIFIIDKNGTIRFIKVGYFEDLYGYIKTRIEFLKGIE
ncbi:MAG: TlpA disulfide reductase family protein [candidate division WOR-3 bacterium]